MVGERSNKEVTAPRLLLREEGLSRILPGTNGNVETGKGVAAKIPAWRQSTANHWEYNLRLATRLPLRHAMIFGCFYPRPFDIVIVEESRISFERHTGPCQGIDSFSGPSSYSPAVPSPNILTCPGHSLGTQLTSSPHTPPHFLI